MWGHVEFPKSFCYKITIGPFLNDKVKSRIQIELLPAVLSPEVTSASRISAAGIRKSVTTHLRWDAESSFHVFIFEEKSFSVR